MGNQIDNHRDKALSKNKNKNKNKSFGSKNVQTQKSWECLNKGSFGRIQAP